MTLVCNETKSTLKSDMGWIERVLAIGWDIQENGCWKWRGSHNPGNSRPRVALNRKQRLVYRITWEAEHGPIPEGLVACHLCDHPWCMNPDHIQPGTQLENVQMMLVHPQLKVTAEIAEAIRAEYRLTTLTQRQLAEKYGVGGTTIARTVKGISRRPNSKRWVRS